MEPHGSSAPTVADHRVPRRGRRLRHRVPGHGGDAAISFISVNAADDLARRVGGELDSAWSTANPGDEIRRDGDEALGGDLIGDAPNPAREAEDLMHDDNDRRLRV